MSSAKQVREFTSLGTDPDTVGMDFKKYRDLGTKKSKQKNQKGEKLGRLNTFLTKSKYGSDLQPDL